MFFLKYFTSFSIFFLLLLIFSLTFFITASLLLVFFFDQEVEAAAQREKRDRLAAVAREARLDVARERLRGRRTHGAARSRREVVPSDVKTLA